MHLDQSELIAVQELFHNNPVLRKWLSHVEARVVHERMTNSVNVDHISVDKALFVEGYYTGKVEVLMALAESSGLVASDRLPESGQR
jgi:hypothetical protein